MLLLIAERGEHDPQQVSNGWIWLIVAAAVVVAILVGLFTIRQFLPARGRGWPDGAPPPPCRSSRKAPTLSAISIISSIHASRSILPKR